MASENHANPYFSVLSGVFGGMYAFFQTNGFLIENGIELIKVILFGFIGGVFGFAGKYLAEKFLKKVKEKSKDICE